MQFGLRAELIPPGLGLFLIEVADCFNFYVGSSEVCTEMGGRDASAADDGDIEFVGHCG